MLMIRRLLGGTPAISSIGSPAKNVGSRSNAYGLSGSPSGLPSRQPRIQSGPFAEPLPLPMLLHAPVDPATTATTIRLRFSICATRIVPHLGTAGYFAARPKPLGGQRHTHRGAPPCPHARRRGPIATRDLHLAAGADVGDQRARLDVRERPPENRAEATLRALHLDLDVRRARGAAAGEELGRQRGDEIAEAVDVDDLSLDHTAL